LRFNTLIDWNENWIGWRRLHDSNLFSYASHLSGFVPWVEYGIAFEDIPDLEQLHINRAGKFVQKERFFWLKLDVFSLEIRSVGLRNLNLENLVQFLAGFTTRKIDIDCHSVGTAFNSTFSEFILAFYILQQSKTEFLHCFFTGRAIVNHSDVCKLPNVELVLFENDLSGRFGLAPDQEPSHFWDKFRLQIEHRHLNLRPKQKYRLLVLEEKVLIICLSHWLGELRLQEVFDFQVELNIRKMLFLAQNHASG
jgi:hypothetical protein